MKLNDFYGIAKIAVAFLVDMKKEEVRERDIIVVIVELKGTLLVRKHNYERK